MWLKNENITCDPMRGMHKSVNYGNKRKHKIRKGDLIIKEDVFDFFNWTCIVCDEEIDKTLEYPDKMSATLEHIVPLSKGGTHTWDNVAPSHLLCNGRKGDTTMEEVLERHRAIWESHNAY
jgi:5-methylcytosine-specific restriction endonuclease McrA